MQTHTEPVIASEHGHPGGHVLPLRTYFAVFAALLALTGVTVLVSYLNLGEASIYAAMAVAIIKASLVVGYFMHLKFDDRFNGLVFIASLLFLVLFFSLTMVDLGSRGSVEATEDNFVLKKEREAKQRAAASVPVPAPSASALPAAGSSNPQGAGAKP